MRVAFLLERALRVDDLRIDVRGRDAEVDEVLQAWHVVAMQWVDERTDQRSFRDDGSARDDVRKLPDTWTAEEVAARVDRTPRAVRLAASEGRLVGERVDGRWQFTPQDVAHWVATRKESA